jgi:hypothetical protein
MVFDYPQRRGADRAVAVADLELAAVAPVRS